MNKDSKIYIAGHHGLVGSAIWNNLEPSWEELEGVKEPLSIKEHLE